LAAATAAVHVDTGARCSSRAASSVLLRLVTYRPDLLMRGAVSGGEPWWEGVRARVAKHGVFRLFGDVVVLAFRGSRAELEVATALRLQAAILLLLLAARIVHLGQAVLDLGLAGGSYTHEGLAVALALACFVESAVFAVVTLHARRLVPGAVLGDAVFGVVGLAVMAIAAYRMPGRAASLNWMLPYTVATATALGVVTVGDLTQGVMEQEALPSGAGLAEAPAERGTVVGWAWRGVSVWPAAVALVLVGVYVVSAYVPSLVDDPRSVWTNAAYYVVFFAAAVGTLVVLRGRLAVMAARNADVSRTAGELAREGQWRAVVVDVFGPVIDLLGRVANLDGGGLPESVRSEADRLISLIDAVRPGDLVDDGERWEHQS
jgi:hypothetical protein